MAACTVTVTSTGDRHQVVHNYLHLGKISLKISYYKMKVEFAKIFSKTRTIYYGSHKKTKTNTATTKRRRYL